MKKLFYMTLLAGVIFSACGTDNEEVNSSYRDKDWFVVYDDPADEVKHAIFELYKKWHVPVFDNDTIGQDTLYWNTDGTFVIHYEILHTSYAIVNEDKYLEFSLTKNKENLLRTVRLLDEEVLPILPPSVRPRSYLVVDTVWKDGATYYWNGRYGRSVAAYRTLNTTFIGEIKGIDTQTPEERKQYCAEIIAEEVSHFLVHKYDAELQNFYTISINAYGVAGTNIYGIQVGSHALDRPYKPFEDIGFLQTSNTMFSQNPERLYKAPTELEDVQMFVTALYRYTEEEFTARYGTNTLIMSKFEIIKKLVAGL